MWSNSITFSTEAKEFALVSLLVRLDWMGAVSDSVS